MANVLALEPLLKQRILELVPGLPAVYDLMQLAGTQDINTLINPYGVFIGLQSHALAASNGRLSRVSSDQSWLVVLAYPFTAQPFETSTAFRAGDVLSALIAGLHGWRAEGYPGNGLRWSSEPQEINRESGYIEMPLTFTTVLNLE